MPKPFVIDVTIDGGAFLSADPVRCRPGRRLIFMIHNEDNTSYDVRIDPAEFVERQDRGTPANPTTANAVVTVTVPAMDSRPLRFNLLPPGQFGKGAGDKRYTTYKYTVRGRITGGADLNPLDPDFDVTPP
jgi:hypothetical protein